MRYALVNVENSQELDEILAGVYEFISNHDFLICFIFKPNVLTKEEIDSSIKLRYNNSELLEMRVITCDVCAEERIAGLFSSVKTNRSILQSAKTVEDIESLLRLQIVSKNDFYKEIGRRC